LQVEYKNGEGNMPTMAFVMPQTILQTPGAPKQYGQQSIFALWALPKTPNVNLAISGD